MSTGSHRTERKSGIKLIWTDSIMQPAKNRQVLWRQQALTLHAGDVGPTTVPQDTQVTLRSHKGWKESLSTAWCGCNLHTHTHGHTEAHMYISTYKHVYILKHAVTYPCAACTYMCCTNVPVFCVHACVVCILFYACVLCYVCAHTLYSVGMCVLSVCAVQV